MKLQHTADPVDVWFDEASNACLTRMGQVGELNSTWHGREVHAVARSTPTKILACLGDLDPDYEGPEPGWEPCIHVEQPAPPMMLFGRFHTEAIPETPVPYLGIAWPCYGSRVGDLVTLSVDHVGGWDGPPGTWTWRMMPMRWIDIGDNSIDESLWLGVWPD